MRNVFITLANISWVTVIVYFDPIIYEMLAENIVVDINYDTSDSYRLKMEITPTR